MLYKDLIIQLTISQDLGQTNKYNLITREKSTRFNDCQIFYVINVLGCSLSSNRRKIYLFILCTCIPEKDSVYHTGSAFTQHYNVCRASFVL